MTREQLCVTYVCDTRCRLVEISFIAWNKGRKSTVASSLIKTKSHLEIIQDKYDLILLRMSLSVC